MDTNIIRQILFHEKNGVGGVKNNSEEFEMFQSLRVVVYRCELREFNHITITMIRKKSVLQVLGFHHFFREFQLF